MLKGGWLIVHLIASAMSAPQAATAGSAGGASCTYQDCMTKCSKLNGQICNSYCEAKGPAACRQSHLRRAGCRRRLIENRALPL